MLKNRALVIAVAVIGTVVGLACWWGSSGEISKTTATGNARPSPSRRAIYEGMAPVVGSERTALAESGNPLPAPPTDHEGAQPTLTSFRVGTIWPLDHYEHDPVFNPGAIDLTDSERKVLDGILKEREALARDVQTRAALKLESWVTQKINRGDYIQESPAATVPPFDPSSIRTFREYGNGVSFIVDTHPGECAELDVAYLDLGTIARQTDNLVHGFFEHPQSASGVPEEEK